MKKARERNHSDATWEGLSPPLLALNMEGNLKPSNMGSLQELEKAKKIPLEAPEEIQPC